MGRKVLLIEPNYRNKYPPIGLMKLASYHRMLGDEVVFYKGDIKEFLLSGIYEKCLNKISKIHSEINWKHSETDIKAYIKTKRQTILEKLIDDKNKDKPLLEEAFRFYADYYKKKEYIKNPEWDRVCITSLFTFYWKITIETIKYAKLLVKDEKELMVGGVMASLLAKELEKETGIRPFKGILDKAGILDPDNDIIIDDLPLDYSILDEIDYIYPTGSAYITFMTRGCTRHCTFCSVPILEPVYKKKVETLNKFQEIKDLYGEQKNLLLMDNNILASHRFPDIIKDIKNMGFSKGAKYIEPNQYDIAIQRLKDKSNDRAFISRSFKLLEELLNKRLERNKKVAQVLYDILDNYKLLERETVIRDNLLKSYKYIKPIYEKYRDKHPKSRYVDFNQGIDARYITEKLMKLISEISIRPLRIAFDRLAMEKKYKNAVRLAAKYHIKELSNYLLYNFKDKPEDLYRRMQINIELSEELKLHIFSFPMKYIPLTGEEAKHRGYVGNNWNKKYIRAIQSILNVTKGIVAPGRTFFEKAFGGNIEEFYELLYMPETYIIYRSIFEKSRLTHIWRNQFRMFKASNLWEETKNIIEKNDFRNIESKTQNPDIIALLKHYEITRDDVEKQNKEIGKIRRKYKTLIKKDRFVELTVTYDFE